MAKKGSSFGVVPENAEREIVLTRVFDAPRELVFKAWTDADHFARWFGPRGVEVPFCKLDARPGGVIHFCHQFSEGGKPLKLWAKGVYREVVAPERLVFTLSFVDAESRPSRHPSIPDWPLDAVITTTVMFENHAGKTKMSVHQVVTPAEVAASEAVAKERKLARLGWDETLDRLAEHLAQA